MERGDGRGVVGTPLVEQKMVLGFLVLVGGLSFLRLVYLSLLVFKVAKFQSFKISKFEFMCLMDIDLIANISKLL